MHQEECQQELSAQDGYEKLNRDLDYTVMHFFIAKETGMAVPNKY
jgi:hypothetical protein